MTTVLDTDASVGVDQAARSCREDATGPTHVRVLIVGTGFAGLGMAIRLKQSGIDDFAVLERADEVGGTWRDNTYPGAACDVPSHLYSFSFAPNPNWSSSFSPQSEIQAYLRACADRFHVRPHVRFRHELISAQWVETDQRWHVESSGGSFVTEVLVSGTGPLSDPAIPALPGLDVFTGKTFHSARWHHDHDLAGESVAVIGTGASAIQIVPEIQPRVAALRLFQRTPPWIVPRWDRRFTRVERWMFRRLPFTQRLIRSAIYWARETYAVGLTVDPKFMRGPERMARKHLEKQVPDPELRAKLTPSYRIGCKRILISSDYLPAVSQPNVDLVTSGISQVRERSIVTVDGTEHPVDTIIFSTGFLVTEMPVAARIIGRDGVALRDHWKDGMQAHRGSTVAGYPNLFFIVGPNTGLGHTSQVFMIEAQIAYVLDALEQMGRRGAGVVEVRAEAEKAWNDEVQEAMGRTVWTTGGCASWYLDARGRNTTLWPSFTFRFRRKTRRFDSAAYRFEPAKVITSSYSLQR